MQHMSTEGGVKFCRSGAKDSRGVNYLLMRNDACRKSWAVSIPLDHSSLLCNLRPQRSTILVSKTQIAEDGRGAMAPQRIS